MKPRTKRQRAFAQDAPGWVPVVGDRVIVRSRPGTLSVCVSVGFVISATLFSDKLEVAIRRGNHRFHGVWGIEDLRPSDS